LKTVIRIENPNDGKGLWQSKENGDNIYYKFSFRKKLVIKHDLFPTPSEDNLNLDDDDFCAFKSIEQIQQWINIEWWEEIFEYGFKVLMIDVSEFKEGKYQILFKKKDILQSKDISSLFK
jgi:hypothetical protein